MNLYEKIAQLKRVQANNIGDWDEYDRLGEMIFELEREL